AEGVVARRRGQRIRKRLMARKRDADDASSKPPAVIGFLVRAADGDTLFRDLYLLRARELLAPIFAESRYRGATGERQEAERGLQEARGAAAPGAAGGGGAEEREEAGRGLQQARVAAARRDWERVRDLSGRAAALQQGLQTTKELCALAESVYDTPPVALDLFSPGLAAPREEDPQSLHADV